MKKELQASRKQTRSLRRGCRVRDSLVQMKNGAKGMNHKDVGKVARLILKLIQSLDMSFKQVQEVISREEFWLPQLKVKCDARIVTIIKSQCIIGRRSSSSKCPISHLNLIISTNQLI